MLPITAKQQPVQLLHVFARIDDNCVIFWLHFFAMKMPRHVCRIKIHDCVKTVINWSLYLNQSNYGQNV